MTPGACPPAHNGQPVHREGAAGSARVPGRERPCCWHRRSTSGCRRTRKSTHRGKRPATQSGIFGPIFRPSYPARVSLIPPGGFRKYPGKGFQKPWRVCRDAFTLARPAASPLASCHRAPPSTALAGAALQGDNDMAGPSWLAGIFAAVMIVTGAYSASRLAASRRRGQATEFDADALHAVMGAAMAGMLVPRFTVLPDGVWVAVFSLGAVWFGWHALRASGLGISGGSPCRFP